MSERLLLIVPIECGDFVMSCIKNYVSNNVMSAARKSEYFCRFDVRSF